MMSAGGTLRNQGTAYQATTFVSPMQLVGEKNQLRAGSKPLPIYAH
jgi:hypothetical protein